MNEFNKGDIYKAVGRAKGSQQGRCSVSGLATLGAAVTSRLDEQGEEAVPKTWAEAVGEGSLHGAAAVRRKRARGMNT